jgi:hypothetical protein
MKSRKEDKYENINKMLVACALRFREVHNIKLRNKIIEICTRLCINLITACKENIQSKV